MTESMLTSLMKLFALLATINVDATKMFSRNFVETYLKSQFSPKMVEKFTAIFDQQMEKLTSVRKHNAQKRITILSVKILIICDEINQQLHLRSKYMILLSIIQFAKYFEANSDSRQEFRETVLDAVDTISEALMINRAEFDNCRSFISDRFFKVPDRSSLLVVSSMETVQFSDVKHYRREGLEGQFFFLKITQADLYIFYYNGFESFELEGRILFPNHVYVFPKGSAIKRDGVAPIYFGDIVTAFRRDSDYPNITLVADEIDFRYPNSDIGVHQLSLSFQAGEMIGVMGGSGTGKSTLMGVLNGNISPQYGRVYINGMALDSEETQHEGMIGFVPQDDLLIEELTVFDNIYYNAKLCLGDLDEGGIIKRIGKVLNNLGLFYIKDLKVGSPLNKFISGGQRKRLNIALELIREPYVLFVDEPTSGLSSTDSENVLTLLKEQALSGKIVVVNIHQPSSDMFKLFDKAVIMDKGGYPVYFGNPLDSVGYLKSIAERADAAEIQCETCGNVQTDDILKIIEAKKVNQFGEFTKDRLLNPHQWYELFKKKIEKPINAIKEEPLPDQNFKIPGYLKQFWIYSRRNFFSKLADKQFAALSLTITPVLAFILGFFTKYLGGSEEGSPVYVFSLNDNLPAYLFMTVIVALFVGLIISAEEIIRDRKIRAREAFLNLSKYAYFNSKIAFLFALSAFQMLVFVVIGNAILGIKGLTMSYWIILFSTSCFAVMLGLNISSGLKSIISIYINIPFILVPLILLSGVIVKYDKLHSRVAGIEHVPVVGDLMASRWAYEALVVNQFKNNNYEKHLFDLEKREANALYLVNFLVPELKNCTEDLRHARKSMDQSRMDRKAALLQNSFERFQGVPEALSTIDAVNTDLNLVWDFLNQYKDYYIDIANNAAREKDQFIQKFRAQHPELPELTTLKLRYQNKAVEELVLNSNELKKIVEYNGRYIRKESPIFQEPYSRLGRAPFFSASKRIGDLSIGTVLFNVLVLWLMTIILYIALVNNWLKKFLQRFEKRHR